MTMIIVMKRDAWKEAPSLSFAQTDTDIEAVGLRNTNTTTTIINSSTNATTSTTTPSTNANTATAR